MSDCADHLGICPTPLELLRAEVERLSDIAMRNADLLIEADERWQTAERNLQWAKADVGTAVRRAESAEAEVATLRATLQRIEDLADKWEGDRLNTVIDKEAAAYLIRDALRNEP